MEQLRLIHLLLFFQNDDVLFFSILHYEFQVYVVCVTYAIVCEYSYVLYSYIIIQYYNIIRNNYYLFLDKIIRNNKKIKKTIIPLKNLAQTNISLIFNIVFKNVLLLLLTLFLKNKIKIIIPNKTNIPNICIYILQREYYLIIYWLS